MLLGHVVNAHVVITVGNLDMLRANAILIMAILHEVPTQLNLVHSTTPLGLLLLLLLATRISAHFLLNENQPQVSIARRAGGPIRPIS